MKVIEKLQAAHTKKCVVVQNVWKGRDVVKDNTKGQRNSDIFWVYESAWRLEVLVDHEDDVDNLAAAKISVFATLLAGPPVKTRVKCTFLDKRHQVSKISEEVCLRLINLIVFPQTKDREFDVGGEKSWGFHQHWCLGDLQTAGCFDPQTDSLAFGNETALTCSSSITFAEVIFTNAPSTSTTPIKSKEEAKSADDDSMPALEPATTPSPTRKRGRPPGSKNKSKQEQTVKKAKTAKLE